MLRQGHILGIRSTTAILQPTYRARRRTGCRSRPNGRSAYVELFPRRRGGCTHRRNSDDRRCASARVADEARAGFRAAARHSSGGIDAPARTAMPPGTVTTSSVNKVQDILFNRQRFWSVALEARDHRRPAKSASGARRPRDPLHRHSGEPPCYNFAPLAKPKRKNVLGYRLNPRADGPALEGDEQKNQRRSSHHGAHEAAQSSGEGRAVDDGVLGRDFGHGQTGSPEAVRPSAAFQC